MGRSLLATASFHPVTKGPAWGADGGGDAVFGGHGDGLWMGDGALGKIVVERVVIFHMPCISPDAFVYTSCALPMASPPLTTIGYASVWLPDLLLKLSRTPSWPFDAAYFKNGHLGDGADGRSSAYQAVSEQHAL